MGRKKTESSEDSPTKDKLPTEEDLSTTEELDADSDVMEEATVAKTEEVDTRTSGEEANDTEIEAQTEVLPEKRGRGRPRKFPKKREGDQTDNGESVVKKKRGRPRKYDGISNGTDKVKSSKKSVPSVYLDFDEEGYPQKRRGRPRKPQVVLTANDNTNEEEYLEWYGEDQTGHDENVVKKKRGRPRKVDEVDYLEWYAEDHNETVVKKKRGRPKKFDTSNGTKKAFKSKKSLKKSLPRILLKGYVDDHYPQKRRGRPRKTNTISHSSSKNESRLGSQVDRLACLVDRLENRINLDGLIDEDTDIESEQEIDKQIFLLQRNFNVKLDLKKDFKGIVKSYLEDLGAVQGCLIATVRSYKNSGRIVLFEIWESEAEQSEFAKDSLSRIFEKESSEMLKNNSVVKNMNIPARWWQRTR